MRLRRTFVALSTVMAFAAFAAGGAQAAQWKIAGNTFAGNASISAARHGAIPLVFHSQILGVNVTLTASNVECLGCTITGGGVKSSGRVVFTGVTVDINFSPAPKCTVRTFAAFGGEIQTKSLVDEVIMDPTAGSFAVFDKFAPSAGGAVAELIFGGSECPLNEVEANLAGTLCGESVETTPGAGWVGLSTGFERVTQSFLFGEPQQLTGGCSLTLGKSSAQFTGALDTKLSGANAGKVFGVS